MNYRIFTGVVPLCAAAFAFGQHIHATINGDPVHFEDVRPVSIDGRVLVPVRGIFEQMGVNVDWSPADQAVYATGNGRVVTLYINKRVARVDDHDVTLDVPAMVYAGRTMVPLRFISESMGARVDWDPNSETVAIDTEVANMPPHEVYTPHPQREVITQRSGGEVRVRHEAPPFRTVVFAANTVIPVVLNDRLSSRTAQVGDTFTANVDMNGSDNYMGMPSGTEVEGHVNAVREMHGDTPGVLGLTFDRFKFPDGRTEDIDGSLIGLDSKSVRERDGRIVARKTDNRDTKYVGVGAGAGALLALVTRGNVVETGVIGAALGYLYGQQQATNMRDVTLHSGQKFGVVLNSDTSIHVR